MHRATYANYVNTFPSFVTTTFLDLPSPYPVIMFTWLEKGRECSECVIKVELRQGRSFIYSLSEGRKGNARIILFKTLQTSSLGRSFFNKPIRCCQRQAFSYDARFVFTVSSRFLLIK